MANTKQRSKMTLEPLSPKMGAVYLIMAFTGAVILNGELSLMWVITGGVCLITGIVGVYLTIVRNRKG
jgi:hydroxyethylthiazole kinase-like sugar kinase family protein